MCKCKGGASLASVPSGDAIHRRCKEDAKNTRCIESATVCNTSGVTRGGDGTMWCEEQRNESLFHSYGRADPFYGSHSALRRGPYGLRIHLNGREVWGDCNRPPYHLGVSVVSEYRFSAPLAKRSSMITPLHRRVCIGSAPNRCTTVEGSVTKSHPNLARRTRTVSKLKRCPSCSAPPLRHRSSRCIARMTSLHPPKGTRLL